MLVLRQAEGHHGISADASLLTRCRNETPPAPTALALVELVSDDACHMKTLVAVLASTLLLSIASIGRAQSQLQIEPNQARANPTLEIPVAVRTGHPPLDLTFVGAWCGYLRVTSTDAPVVPGAPAMKLRSECARFARRGDSIFVDAHLRLREDGAGPDLAKLGVKLHVVSQYAEATSAQEVTVTDVIGVTSPNARATGTLSYDMKLTGAGRMEVVRTDRLQVTDLKYSPVGSRNVRWSGSLYTVQLREYQAWEAAHGNDAPVGGGGDVYLPGAR